MADPARTALAGWSCGGYLIAGIVTVDDRIAAAFVGAGFSALDAVGVENVLVRYPGEGHSLRTPAVQDHAWERYHEWIRRHLEDDSAGVRRARDTVDREDR